jgi:hypothetical protein
VGRTYVVFLEDKPGGTKSNHCTVKGLNSAVFEFLVAESGKPTCTDESSLKV